MPRRQQAGGTFCGCIMRQALTMNQINYVGHYFTLVSFVEPSPRQISDRGFDGLFEIAHIRSIICARTHVTSGDTARARVSDSASDSH